MTASNKRIAKNTLMLYSRQLFILLVNLYTVRVLLNVLGVEDYGTYNVVAGIVALFSFLSNTMMSATQRFFSFALGRNDDAQLTIKPNIWGGLAAATLHIPFIAFVCGLGHSMIRNGYLFRIIKYLYTFSFRFAYEVWFINSDDRQIMEEHKIIRHEKSRLLKGEGIDCSRFSCSASCSERFVFLLSARMLWEKGIAEFVKAAGILKERYPDIRCQLLGFVDSGNPSGIPRETLELWSKDGCVEYLGSVSDVVPFVEAADCIVLPSYYREGIPFSLLEGAAAGKPLIAAQSPGCTEVVLENVTGFLCKPRDAEDLAEKMEKLLLLPLPERRKLGMLGRKLVEETFSINKIIPQYLQVISVVFSDQKQV